MVSGSPRPPGSRKKHLEHRKKERKRGFAIVRSSKIERKTEGKKDIKKERVFYRRFRWGLKTTTFKRRLNCQDATSRPISCRSCSEALSKERKKDRKKERVCNCRVFQRFRWGLKTTTFKRRVDCKDAISRPISCRSFSEALSKERKKERKIERKKERVCNCTVSARALPSKLMLQSLQAREIHTLDHQTHYNYSGFELSEASRLEKQTH